MSPTGKGQVEFDDSLGNPSGTARRKGVAEFGNDESPETTRACFDYPSRSEQDFGSGGKTRIDDQKSLATC